MESVINGIETVLPKMREQQHGTILSFTLGVGIAVMLGGVITEYWHWQGCFWFLLRHILLFFGISAANSTRYTEVICSRIWVLE